LRSSERILEGKDLALDGKQQRRVCLPRVLDRGGGIAPGKIRRKSHIVVEAVFK
jgi:hypothetical protein